MNCYVHTDIPATAYCRTCGRALCVNCQRPANGTVFCPEHAPAAAYASPADPYASATAAASNPYIQPGPAVTLPVQTSPGLAFLLGLIPGVGAIYNGQYMKGLVHAVIFGFFMSFANAADNTAGQPILAMLAVAFYLYMPFEAYHTARKRQLGIPVDEWSSLIAQNRFSEKTPVGPIVLILLGVFFLLDSLHLISFHAIGRFWPVILIVAGAGMLYSRLSPGGAGTVGAAPAADPTYTRPPEAGKVAETGHER
jgi:TM2 domain-containing membrane protein YozV